MFKTIIVGTDASANADQAVAFARSLVDPVVAGSKIILVHVIEFVGGKGGEYPVAADEPELQAKLKHQADELRSDGIEVQLEIQPIRTGGPAHVIAAEARAAGAEVIVVGSRGRSPLAQYVLGSVPLRLLHVAHCPVLVVPDDKNGTSTAGTAT